MSTIQGIAQSGLEAASTRVNVSAHNVANALTPGFRPVAVATEERLEGGVEARIVPNDPQVESRLDAAALGYGAASGTDLATELVSQMAASASYRASLASLPWAASCAALSVSR